VREEVPHFDHRGKPLSPRLSPNEFGARLRRHARERPFIAQHPPPQPPQPPTPPESRRDRLWKLLVNVFIGVFGLVFILCLLATCAALAFLPGVLISQAFGGTAGAGVLATVFFGAGILACAVVYNKVVPPKPPSPENLAHMRWPHELCGGCGYALTGLQPADDDCVTCPECSAAWRPGWIAHVPCPNCQGELAGNELRRDGSIYCPNCETAIPISPHPPKS
jgi:hypothetical protein